uniref:Uncharacterized protein n=1 Tax=Anguilla anguilla TaxID=7936 RepID=A0A0E9X3A3_ANGAN
MASLCILCSLALAQGEVFVFNQLSSACAEPVSVLIGGCAFFHLPVLSIQPVCRIHLQTSVFLSQSVKPAFLKQS